MMRRISGGMRWKRALVAVAAAEGSAGDGVRGRRWGDIVGISEGGEEVFGVLFWVSILRGCWWVDYGDAVVVVMS